jgi:hypothetical protein
MYYVVKYFKQVSKVCFDICSKCGYILSRLRGDYRRGLDWMIGFIDNLYTPHGTTRNYK